MKDSENKLSGSMHSFKRMLSFGILMVIAMTLFAQVKNVSGVVLDKKGESIIGASVLVKGTTNGTITGTEDGDFSLSGVKKSDVIAFTYIGFKNKEVKYEGQKQLNVSWKKIQKHWKKL